ARDLSLDLHRDALVPRDHALCARHVDPAALLARRARAKKSAAGQVTLADAIEAATSAAVKELFRTHLGEKHFDEVRRMFHALGRLDFNDPLAWQRDYDFRFSAMEEAMARLDQAGLFGTGAQRANIVINVEVMPPDHTNVERARRLNPPEALIDWL